MPPTYSPNSNETVRLLSQMSDQAAFERLAAAVLREASPVYAALAHPGVNAQGKTVKSPLDGISFVAEASPLHLVAVHHTTSKAADLINKWLHDPATVRPRKEGKPAAPAGDLVKTAKIVAEEREHNPAMKATLALTTNEEPPEELVRALNRAGAASNILIDLWTRSRLAHFLDSPKGQWIRSQFLGIPQEHLTRELLRELSRKSISVFRPSDTSPEAWVPRTLDGELGSAGQRDILFVVADSGLGKSVACYKLLAGHIERGGNGLVISHQNVAEALTLDHAVELVLRQLHPSLVEGAGLQARLFSSPTNPLILVVEDVNLSAQPSQLVEKISTWTQVGQPEANVVGSSWRLYCPLWPRVLQMLKDQARKRVDALSIACETFSPNEARSAIQRRAALKGHSISDINAESIAAALGFDPLLIALHGPSGPPDVQQVIYRFVQASVARIAATHPEFTEPDYRAALHTLMTQMLRHRQLEPTWEVVCAWQELSQESVAMLRRLVSNAELIRLAGVSSDRLAFRHDRVRDALLSMSIAIHLAKNTLGDAIVADPYFAEVLGAALLDEKVSPDTVARVGASSPLAALHCLRILGSRESIRRDALVKSVQDWSNTPSTHTTPNRQMRWEALQILGDSEGPHVLDQVKALKDQTWGAWQAQLRNGDITGGIHLCCAIEPGSNAPWRDRQIEHAKHRFGAKLCEVLASALRSAAFETSARSGVLRLAGHLAEPTLAEAIEFCWHSDPARIELLQDYLWAAAKCCGDSPERFLSPIMDAWASLPAEGKNNMPSDRDELAAHNVRWAFHQWPPGSAIRYFIARGASEDLRWPITYLLHGLDHPDAVEFVAGEMAAKAQTLEKSNSFSPLIFSAQDDWRRRVEYGGSPMSPSSKERLLALWQLSEGDTHLRRVALRLWSATEAETDLSLLRAVPESDALFGTALFERLRRRDAEAIPHLVTRLCDKNEYYWWQAGRYIWTEQMTSALDASLTRRGQAIPRTWDQKFEVDWITSEMVMRLPVSTAETLLLKHWDHLRYSSNFVQAALYTATPQLLNLAAESVKESPKPGETLQYLATHFGIKSSGRAGITRREQMEALTPYLSLLGRLTIGSLWEVCNKRGWFDFRRAHLDALQVGYHNQYLTHESRLGALDEMVNEKRTNWIDHWLEGLLETGISHDDAIGLLHQWLLARKSIESLEVVANGLISIGHRADLKILDVNGIVPTDIASSIVDNARFAVMRRSLQQ